MAWIQWTAVAILLVVAGIVVLSAWGALRWRGATSELTLALEAARMPHAIATFEPRELDGLPAPVQRYLRAVLAGEQAIVAAAGIGHAGTFNLGEDSERWTGFSSMQRVLTRRPGFVWNGRISMFPGVAVRVHDAYVAGEGILHPALFGLFTLTQLRGKGEIARGELMRYLAEAVWYPTALLPGQGVRWEAVDERSAKATLVDGETSVTLLFRFGDDGLVAAVWAPARGRSVRGQMVPTPWEGRFSNYRRREGLLVPMSGEVAWLPPEGPRPYWRGTITALSYEFAN